MSSFTYVTDYELDIVICKDKLIFKVLPQEEWLNYKNKKCTIRLKIIVSW